MTRLRSYLRSIIIRKRAKTCSKAKITIWRVNDFAQALSKRLTNIIIIAFENAATITITLSLYRFRV